MLRLGIDSYLSLQRENLGLAFKTGEAVGIARTLVITQKHRFLVKTLVSILEI